MCGIAATLELEMLCCHKGHLAQSRNRSPIEEISSIS
jgi:hypothetical protein